MFHVFLLHNLYKYEENNLIEDCNHKKITNSFFFKDNRILKILEKSNICKNKFCLKHVVLFLIT